jgi:AcrR family transcriptional regulator
MNIHSDMPRPSERPSQRAVSAAGARDKADAIKAAALELFNHRGFYGTAVPEIAERAGVGAGTIYRYFPSKEALVNALYREHKLVFARHVLGDLPASAPTREQFRLIWMRMARFAIDHTHAFAFLELHHHAPYLDADSRAVEQRMLDAILQVIAAAQARGELKPGPPRLLVGIVLGAFVGVLRSMVELGHQLGDADWTLAEQCVWEAVRS